MKLLYYAAFMCVLKGKPIVIGTEISREYVCYTEEIADISYSHGTAIIF